jgi:excisionase family DNA binding protein
MSRRRKALPEVLSSPVTQPTQLIAPVRGLRVADAAKYAGVSHWFVRTAVWQGKLRAYRAGKVIVILRDDLDRWLNSLPEVQRNDAKWLSDRQQKSGAS